MEKFYKISRDAMFKSIFCKDENKVLLERLIKEAIHEEVEVIKLSMSELPKDKISSKGKTLDVLVKTNDNKEINIEINSETTDYLRRRNASYIFKMYSNGVKVNGTYQKMGNYIQINLSSKLNKDYPKIATYTLYDKDNKLNFIDNLKIYEINLAKYKEFCYDKDIKDSVIGMLDMNYEELIKVKGDADMERLKEEAIKLNNDEDFIRLMTDEEEEELLKNSFMQEAREQGIEEGTKLGLEEGTKLGAKQNTIDLTKKMLEEKADINFISKVTGLSIEEITKLKDEL